MSNPNGATKETTPFVLFKAMAVEEAGLTVEAANQFRARIGAAYDMGEAVWMVADELKLRASRPRPNKSPRELALRVVRAA